MTLTGPAATVAGGWLVTILFSPQGGAAPADTEAIEVALRYYDGLIHATARRCVAFCEEDYDDVVQVLRVKAWQALRAYDPQRCRTTRDRYVFMCVRDRAKDVVKKKKRNQLHIEDLRDSATDRFDARYLCSTHEDNYAAIDDDDDPLLQLDELERAIARLLTSDYKQAQVARALGLQKVEMDRAMKSIRYKLADLRPPEPAVIHPLPAVAA